MLVLIPVIVMIVHVDDACLHSTAVNCGTLTNPANGRVSHSAGTTFGQTATYSCNTGYTRVGVSTRTCQSNAVWTGSAPTCQGMLLLLCMCTTLSKHLVPSICLYMCKIEEDLILCICMCICTRE